ncbi:MAG TPA: PD-(D/E)XK nuclease family protein [Acidimicrobiales bacterium]|nr:PD-(D/E)XK nuclease family protein [Acidimicrobiales bacterium]
MTSRALNPAQQRVVDDLLAISTPRPSFAEGVDLALLDRLEGELHEVADRLDPLDLHVNKSMLGQVLACEAHHESVTSERFRWTVSNTRGVIAHRAIELAVFAPPGTAPLSVVDDVIERIAEEGDDRSPRDFLRCATAVELAELRGGASQVVTAFEAQFPPLEKAWRPRVEAPCRVELCGRRIVLRAKVDLALGRPVGNEARVLLVDIKTGNAWPGHLDDLRYYALCETLRSGVPPFRIATYYLETGRWQHEEVTLDLLETAARRVIEGVTRLADLRLRERPAAFTSGPTCSFCSKRDDCPGGREWAERREEAGVSAA